MKEEGFSKQKDVNSLSLLGYLFFRCLGKLISPSDSLLFSG